jgi:hypothetical protein
MKKKKVCEFNSDINVKAYYGHAHILSDIERRKKYFFQRKLVGFDDTELWSLDHTIIKFILPRLKAFLTAECGLHPIDSFESKEEKENFRKFKKDLRFIIKSFSEYKDCFSGGEKLENVKKSFVLLAEHFGGLWI